MHIATTEEISIQSEGIQRILAEHVARTHGVDASSVSTSFDVGVQTSGYGMGEHDVTVFRSAKAAIATVLDGDDVLDVLGRRSFSYEGEELKKIIADYVARARKRDVEPASVVLTLQGRRQGDRGGWEGPSLDGAVVTIRND